MTATAQPDLATDVTAAAARIAAAELLEAFGRTLPPDLAAAVAADRAAQDARRAQ